MIDLPIDHEYVPYVKLPEVCFNKLQPWTLSYPTAPAAWLGKS